MTIDVSKLSDASFREVPFLIDSTSVTEGRKTVTHEYINTDRRFVEDLGKLPRVFTVEAVITGADYLQKKADFQQAINTAGVGKLVHPFYGETDVVAKPSVERTDIKEYGVSRFTVTFEQSGVNIFPKASGSNKAEINRERDNSIASSQAVFENTFQVELDHVENFFAAQEKVTQSINSVIFAKNSVVADATAVSDFDNKAVAILDDINRLVATPTDLAQSYTDIFNLLEGTAPTPIEQFASIVALFGFGINDVITAQTTAKRIEKEQNRKAVNDVINVNALITAYSTASNIDYETEVDLEQVQQILNDQYDLIIDSDIDNNLLNDITSLRNQARIFFEDVGLDVARIINIKVNTQPVTTVAYSYYGNLDNYDKIINLNGILNPAFMSGNNSILTDD